MNYQASFILEHSEKKLVTLKKHEIYVEAIFFMTYFYRAGGGHGPLGPAPGSATDLY